MTPEPNMSDSFSMDPAVVNLAKAMQHPIRVRILGYLQEHDAASPSQLSAEWDLRLNVVAYHCRRLESLGLVSVVRRIERGGSIEHRYALTADAPGEGRLTLASSR